MSDEIVIPDLTTEVTGYRAWKVIGSFKIPLLASVTHSGTVWHPDRWTYALCGNDVQCPFCAEEDDFRVPGENCSCGLYSARDRSHLTGMSYNRERDGKPVVIGEVGLAGKVIPGSQGYRAEKGRVKRLYVPFHQWRWIEPLSEYYNVPVQPDNVLNATSSLGREV